MLSEQDINEALAPLKYPLRDVEPDVKFRDVTSHSRATSQMSRVRVLRSSESTASNSRKRRNIDNMSISGLSVDDALEMPPSPMKELLSESSELQEPVITAEVRQSTKRRLLNSESNTTITDESSNTQIIPASNVSTTSILHENSIEEAHPPLPSPGASPLLSHGEEDGVMTDDEERSRNKDTSYIKIATTGEGVLPTVEKLIEFLTQKEKNILTWKLLSQTDRSRLSILNNAINVSLKRDMISTLPTEIAYKILGYLDAKSLIHAEQVSRNWFTIVNRSNGLWKVLVKKDRFVNSEEELQGEVNNKEELLRDWFRKNDSIPQLSNNIPQDLYKQVYKKRSIIHNRWMNPNFQPKRITVMGHGAAVITCLQFDDDKIITGADDNVISVYDTRTGKLRKSLEGHTGGVWALKYYKNTLVSGATDRTVRVWNIKQGRCTHVFRGHTSTVRCLDILIPEVIGHSSTGVPIVFPQEPLLITGSRDNTIHVWKLPIAEEDDVDTGEPFDGVDQNNPYFVRALRGHTASVRCIAGRGNIVVTGSYDMTVRVWDLTTGRCKLVLRSHTDRVYSTVLDMERNRCISGSMDSTVKIWDLEDGHCIATLEGHSSLVGLLDLSETALVSAAADSTLRVWDPQTGDPRFQLKGHTGAITCFQHDDKKVVSGSEKMLKLWDINTGKFVRELLPEVSGSTWQVRFDHRRCVAAVQHRHEESQPDETLMEILDFGEPLYPSSSFPSSSVQQSAHLNQVIPAQIDMEDQLMYDL